MRIYSSEVYNGTGIKSLVRATYIYIPTPRINPGQVPGYFTRVGYLGSIYIEVKSMHFLFV